MCIRVITTRAARTSQVQREASRDNLCCLWSGRSVFPFSSSKPHNKITVSSSQSAHTHQIDAHRALYRCVPARSDSSRHCAIRSAWRSLVGHSVQGGDVVLCEKAKRGVRCNYFGSLFFNSTRHQLLRCIQATLPTLAVLLVGTLKARLFTPRYHPEGVEKACGAVCVPR